MVSKRNDHYMIIDKKKIVFFWVIIFMNPNAQIKLQKKKKIMKHISYHL